MLDRILVKRGYLFDYGKDTSSPAYAAKLLNQFGVEVDKPTHLSKKNVETIAEFYGTCIPNSFYANPQDLKHFSCGELLLEQLISYFKIGFLTGINSNNETDFDRIDLFKKALPNYEDGDEVVLRTYKIINQSEANNILNDIMDNYCKYTRQWSNDEKGEIQYLIINGHYNDQHIDCKDNAISLFLDYKDKKFAKMLDKKDVVKLSVELKGENKELIFNQEEKALLQIAIQNAYDCPLSKKQAKFYNTISKKVGAKLPKETNKNSPYKLAKNKLKNSDVLGAATIFFQNGSLLERNLVWLLSRASIDECKDILNMIKTDKPIVLYQLLQGIIRDDYKNSRVFKFYKNKKLKTHIETEYEHEYRKSILSIGIKNMLKNIIQQKIKETYEKKPKLGNIYISDEFKKIALPTNTSASGSGLDVLPTGSRLKITDDYIRTFCYWQNAFDIDTSAIMVKDFNSPRDVMYWGNYSKKQFGNSALCSGDDRSANGAEYQDFKISELLEKGYKYIIYTLNGFNSTLNDGEIYCGYQNKNDLETQSWSAKNIAIKIKVCGNSRAYVGFAIDLENKEMVILNQMLDSNNRIVDDKTFELIKDYLLPDYLRTFNMYKLLSYRGNIVENIEDADFVFDRDYIGKENQQIIRPFHIETLVNLLN